MYEEQREDRGNNLLGNVVIGAGLLGAGLLGANYAQSVLKNRNRKAQQVNVNVEQPTGRSGTQMRDLPLLRGSDNSGRSSSPPPRKSQYPSSQEAMKKYMRDIEGGSLGADYRPTSGPVTGENVGKTWQMNRDYYKAEQEGLDLLTDPRTGEIYRRGGSRSVNQIKTAPVNQGGGINLSKQNLMGQGSLTTDQMLSFGQRKSRPDVDYVRGRIAKDLEAGIQSAGPSVQLRSLPPADRVAQLLSEVGVDEMGRMTAGREVAQEAAQMAATESSSQSAAVRRMEKQAPEFERLAKQILSEMRSESSGGGINDEKAARIARNRQKDVSRIADMISDSIQTEIDEGILVPGEVLRVGLDAQNTGTVTERGANTFRNWMQGAYKNDPTVLREMNEELSSVFPQQTTEASPLAQPKRSGDGGPKFAGYSEGPVDAQDRKHIQAAQRDQAETLVQVRQKSAPFARDASNEAIQTANDQRDLQIIKHIQRNEDVDLTRFNEDVLDRRVADARDYFIRRESDQQYNYDVENQRQTAHLANQIINELQLEGRAERDLVRSQSEGAPTTITTKSGKVRTVPERYLRERSGYADTFEIPGDLRGDGELAGLTAIDNTRQRSELQGSKSMTGEQLEEVLLGESKAIDKNMRNRALRGGSPAVEGNYYRNEGDISYTDDSGQWRDASTGTLTNTPYVASGPKTPEGAASILASEAIRKQYQPGRPEPLRGPAADVGRSMATLREGMSVEPSEILPSTQVPTVVSAGYEYEDDTAKGVDRGKRMDVIAVSPELAFTGDAADAAGPISRARAGNSPPLTQGTIRSNPEAAAANEGMAQSFLEKAISGGLTQRGMSVAPVYETADEVPKSFGLTPSVEEYKTPRIVGPAEAGPGRVPFSRSAVADPQSGPDPSQRTGYARYLIADEKRASKPVGTPSTGAMTVGINYAELPKSTAYRPSDVGRTLPNLSANPAAVARTMSFADSEAPTRTVYRDTKTGYDYVAHPMQPSQVREVTGPKSIAFDAGPVRMSVSPDPSQTYAPQALAGKNPPRTYPRMRGNALFPEYAMINNPDLRGGPVKFEGREKREDEYVRPISERLGRGDTMKRFPIIRRG